MINISVIVPVYNVERYVYRCLHSVIRQLEDDIEIIIINDGSTDNSAGICEKIISNLPKEQIRMFHQANQGLSSARNRGLRESNGRYVMFLDADDEIGSDSLSVLKEKIKEKPDVDVFYFDAEVLDELNCGKRKNAYDRKRKVPANTIIDSINYFSEYYVDNMIVSACLCLIKKSVLEENRIGFEVGRLYEDNLFSLELILNSRYVCYLPFNLYMRRYRAESITTRKISHKDIEDMSHIVRGYLRKYEAILQFGNVIFFNSYMALIYKTYLWGKQKMIQEHWNLECMVSLPDEIFDRLSSTPAEYRSLSYYVFMYRIGKGNEFIPNIKEGYKSLLDKLKQHAGDRISVYGMGKHTDLLLQMLKKNNLSFADDLIYIDSYKADGIDEQNRTIVNISNAETRTDLIIISSYYYRLEMLRMCEKYAPTVEIFDFYKDEKINLFEDDSVLI